MTASAHSRPASGRRRRTGGLLAVAVVCVLAVGALLAFRGGGGPQSAVTTYAAADRKPAPALTGTTLDGEPFSLADLRGHVVVVNVWGSWCGPCRVEAPALERVATATRSQGVAFVGIDVRDDVRSAQAFVQKFSVGYPSIDASTDTGPLLALRGVLPVSPPATMVLDRTGRVAATVIGGVTEPGLRALLDPVVAEGA